MLFWLFCFINWCGVKRLLWAFLSQRSWKWTFLVTAVLPKLWSGIDRIKSIIFILQILGDIPSGDVLLTVFREKKDKDQNTVSWTKKIAYFWFPQGMIIFPGGERLKWNFQRVGGRGLFWEPILENPEGGRGHGKNPFHGGYGYFLELHNVHCHFLFLKSEKLLWICDLLSKLSKLTWKRSNLHVFGAVVGRRTSSPGRIEDFARNVLECSLMRQSDQKLWNILRLRKDNWC